MKTRMIKSAGVILLATLMTLAVDAQYNRQGGRGMGPANDEGRYARLDLTEAQSEELKALRTEQYKSMKPLRAKMGEIRAKEQTLLAEETVDLKELDKLIDQQSELMNKIRKEQIRHRLAMKDILTDEQVMQLEQRSRRAFHHGQGRKGQGFRSGPGYEDGPGYGRGSGRGYNRSGRI
jgi:Spy/CpxP family protein refolding chaperone